MASRYNTGRVSSFATRILGTAKDKLLPLVNKMLQSSWCQF
jgi:hypothetical protein